jgi:cysteinyl-tRNA synthetase
MAEALIRMTRQEAIEIQTNPAWRALAAEMERAILMDYEKLINAKGDDVIRVQEHIKALREAIRLPVNIAENREMEGEDGSV